MSLKNRREEYSWPRTGIDRLLVVTDKKTYSTEETVRANVAFRIVGGLREAFHPDVWTVAWEDFDKKLRLHLRVSLGSPGGLGSRKLAETGKQVRIASFYWSRDPDLPYRIWVMVMPEGGGAPQIPTGVEDAKSKMLDVEKDFGFPASALGAGTHKLVAEANGEWGRRSFIEKGGVSSKSAPSVIKIE